MFDISKLNFEKLNGLIPAIITDTNKTVLMLGFMNKEALSQTLETKRITFFSRTRNKLWIKGETSGNYLNLVKITPDCDNDTLLIEAIPEGNTCHNGDYSCFGINKNNNDFLQELFNLIKDRKQNLPDKSYTTKLFMEGSNRIIQKVGEEAIETIIAAKNLDKNEIVNEVSDLVYHLFVMLADQEIEFTQIIQNLSSRHKK